MDPQDRRLKIHREELKSLLELFLDNALSQARESSAGSSGRRGFYEDAGLNRLNPAGLFGPPFPVARSGEISGKANASRPL